MKIAYKEKDFVEFTIYTKPVHMMYDYNDNDFEKGYYERQYKGTIKKIEDDYIRFIIESIFLFNNQKYKYEACFPIKHIKSIKVIKSYEEEGK
jgi:hypothetical protein